MKFVPRTTAPSITNKYYIKAGKGGYNRAAEIDKDTHFCLPNCCGLVHARWLEGQKQTDYKKYDKLCTGNAHSYWKKKDGYKRGQIPKLGAIACYSGGEYGHVAFVEKVYSNGDCLLSNSADGGSKFYTRRVTKKSNYAYSDKYKLQGFIYPPVEFTTTDVTPTVSRDENKNQLKVKTTELRVRSNHNTKAKIIDVAKENGIYNYYEIVKENEYDWYRIADNQWIANNGKWLEIYTKKKQEETDVKKEDTTDELNKLKEENEQLKAKCNDLESKNQELTNCINNFKSIYKCPQNGSYKINIELKENEELYLIEN